MFPDLPLERGGEWIRGDSKSHRSAHLHSTKSPKLWFPPAPHSLHGQLPRAGPFLSLWQLLSCLAGMPLETLPQVQPPRMAQLVESPGSQGIGTSPWVSLTTCSGVNVTSGTCSFAP